MFPPEAFEIIANEYEPEPPVAVKLFVPFVATEAVIELMASAGLTVTSAEAMFPSESVTVMTSVTLPPVPAVYAPPDTLPPERFAVNDHVNPVPLPPRRQTSLAERRDRRAAGVIVTPAPTETSTVALLPSESVTWTVSFTFGFAPAWYAPVDAADGPARVVRHDRPGEAAFRFLPSPVNATLPCGGVEGAAGVIATPPPTETFTLAVLPSASATCTVSTTAPVLPAGAVACGVE